MGSPKPIQPNKAVHAILVTASPAPFATPTVFPGCSVNKCSHAVPHRVSRSVGRKVGRLLDPPLRAQRGLKRAAGVLCCDGKGDSLSKRQSAGDGRFRSRPVGLSGWPALFVALFRRVDTRLQKDALIANQPESLNAQGGGNSLPTARRPQRPD